MNICFLKGGVRKQYRVWYDQFCNALEDHPNRKLIPKFNEIEIVMQKDSDGGLDWWGFKIHTEPKIIINEEFLKAFGDINDIVEHLFKHELVHFFTRDHRDGFRDIMIIHLGYDYDCIQTCNYIRKYYGLTFFNKRWDFSNKIAKRR